MSEDVIERKKGTSLYSFNITGDENVKTVIDRFRIDPDDREIDLKNIDNNSIANFLAGVFLSCGSVNNPESGYHLEFVINSCRLCDDLNRILG